ncbi:hypothetical protein BU26DRAFT_71778 [Trematosphaeria pertusa]|uniref:Uncharacterized protein n=1 Tax=Trematosphaeria pertusa TaxID=390896 RepID=A0A6A6I5W0_9PLEO|nr:uncharacterized protein BU26DRAFT_71778 [Trematosphaeria pertusa]KAF2245609.1 hypothetical protein BU26DRAFT_71778 [Trematosphaeria pertusa]
MYLLCPGTVREYPHGIFFFVWLSVWHVCRRSTVRSTLHFTGVRRMRSLLESPSSGGGKSIIGTAVHVLGIWHLVSLLLSLERIRGVRLLGDGCGGSLPQCWRVMINRCVVASPSTSSSSSSFQLSMEHVST